MARVGCGMRESLDQSKQFFCTSMACATACWHGASCPTTSIRFSKRFPGSHLAVSSAHGNRLSAALAAPVRPIGVVMVFHMSSDLDAGERYYWSAKMPLLIPISEFVKLYFWTRFSSSNRMMRYWASPGMDMPKIPANGTKFTGSLVKLPAQ